MFQHPPTNLLKTHITKYLPMIHFRHERVRPHQKDLMEDIHRAISGRRIFMAQAPTGMGKCIAGDSFVFTAKGLILAKELIKGRANSLRGGQFSLKEGYKVKIAKEKLLKLKTRHGYEIKTTYSHKFLTPCGWREATDLKEGDFVATSRKFIVHEQVAKEFSLPGLPSYAKNYKIKFSEKIAYFLGAFIGDGSYNSNIRVRFTLKNKDIVQNLSKALADLGLYFCRYKKHDYHVDSIVLKKFLEKYGAPDVRIGKKGGKCGAVFVHNDVICSPRNTLSAFLRGLFDTDGYVEKTNIVCLTSKSKKLIRTLKYALLRFGIISQMRVKKNKIYGNYWLLRISAPDSIKIFINEIGFSVKEKQKRLGRFISLAKKPNPNIDVVPLDKNFIFELRKYIRPSSNKPLYNLLCLYLLDKRKPTLISINRMVEHLKKVGAPIALISRLQSHLDSGILWDRIVSIKAHGVEDVYDFCIPGTHNFVADAFIVHNSDAALSAAIGCALENDLNVFFLTPKISQHRIAVEVVKGLAEKHSLNLRAVDIVGRSHCCIDKALQHLDGDSFQSACTRRRKKQECIYYANARGFNRNGEARANARFQSMLQTYGSVKSHDELIAMGNAAAACPYEWLLKIAETSNVIIADYYHLMIPEIRDVFLMKVKKRAEDSVIIIDEAHNLASRIRDSLSSTIGTYTFRRMTREMRVVGLDAGPVEEEFDNWARRLLGKNGMASNRADEESGNGCETNGSESESWQGKQNRQDWRGQKNNPDWQVRGSKQGFGQERERVVSSYSFEEFITSFGFQMDEIIKKLGDAGFQFVEKTGKKSACLKLARFLADWKGGDEESVRVIRQKGEFFSLSKRLLDPSPAARVLNQCASAVLMSGTLLPLEMHRDILGLDRERTVMKSYPSPFDPQNTVNIIADGVTTRYSRRDPENYAAMAAKLDAVVSSTPGGTAIFFPSYVVMDRVLPLMHSGDLLVQKSAMRPHAIRQLLRDFKNGGVLCGVQGGSLAEGVDYCDGQIKTVVIVGVALDEMDVEAHALIDYYDEKFGRGWDYGYLYPGTIKALQAAGRARRKESDRVAIVYMDERFRWSKYNWILNRSERMVVTGSPEEEVGRFWRSDIGELRPRESAATPR